MPVPMFLLSRPSLPITLLHVYPGLSPLPYRIRNQSDTRGVHGAKVFSLYPEAAAAYCYSADGRSGRAMFLSAKRRTNTDTPKVRRKRLIFFYFFYYYYNGKKATKRTLCRQHDVTRAERRQVMGRRGLCVRSY